MRTSPTCGATYARRESACCCWRCCSSPRPSGSGRSGAAVAGADRPDALPHRFPRRRHRLRALSILPARVGDLLRPYLVARQDSLPFTSTFATIVMERVLDLIAVLALMAIYVWVSPTRRVGAAPRRTGRVFRRGRRRDRAALLVIMWVLAPHPERIGTLVHSTERVLPHRIARQLGDWPGRSAWGLRSREAAGFLIALLWSFPLWMPSPADVGRDAGVRDRTPVCRHVPSAVVSRGRRRGSDARGRRQLPRGLSLA